MPFQYGITAMPTLLVLKGGKVAEQRVGKMSREQLAKLLDATCSAAGAPERSVAQRAAGFGSIGILTPRSRATSIARS